MIRFDRFELSPATRQLFREGAPVSLEPQPAALLVLLISRAGELVTHDEIRQHLWGADTHVNYQEGLHYCVRQVRLALGDVARDSRYIETVPRRGYRFRAGLVEAEPVAPLRPPRIRRALVAAALAGLVALGVLVEQRPNRHHDIAVTWVSWAHDLIFLAPSDFPQPDFRALQKPRGSPAVLLDMCTHGFRL
jgi:DNA-binding winged helix-turn-helix (wHTH) protein